MKRLVVVAILAACGNDRAVDSTADAAVDPDPLAVTFNPAANSLDDLHQRIIAKRCSGAPGLCHNGQFEPNLSTPAMTYAYLVRRPGIEKPNRLRVNPGDPSTSLLVDKLRNRNVATQMPLGAEPLAETDIQAIEGWITAGALRAPGADPAPMLNNPPKRPEIAIYDSTGKRLDATGPISIAVGTQLVLRHTVQDFETPDTSMPFTALLLIAEDNRNVALTPAAMDPSVALTAYDAAGPAGKGDVLDFKYSWTIPSTLALWDRATKVTTNVSAHGHTLTVLVAYVDQAQGGIAVFDTCPSTIQIP